MNQLIKKFREVVRRTEADRGEVVLFGLFLREDSAEDGWDVVVSARWLDGSRLEGMRYLAKVMGQLLKPDEMLELSRIVPMETSDEGLVRFANWAGSIETPFYTSNFDFAGARIREAHVLAARPVLLGAGTKDAPAGP